MTDTSSKPTWKRCSHCRQRVYNDPIDWEGHTRNCPADIQDELERLTKRLDKLNLADRLDALEQADPADFDSVDEPDPDNEDDQQSQYAGDLPDDDIDEPAPVRPIPQIGTAADYYPRPLT